MEQCYHFFASILPFSRQFILKIPRASIVVMTLENIDGIIVCLREFSAMSDRDWWIASVVGCRGWKCVALRWQFLMGFPSEENRLRFRLGWRRLLMSVVTVVGERNAYFGRYLLWSKELGERLWEKTCSLRSCRICHKIQLFIIILEKSSLHQIKTEIEQHY